MPDARAAPEPAAHQPPVQQHGRGPLRTRARKGALDILFESDLRGLEPGATLAERQSDAAAGGAVVRGYTARLVAGVRGSAARIDDLLSTYTEGWSLDRMAAVDRNILRLAVWELLEAPDVPVPVVISEAVGLARDLSTDASPAFVNGVLSRISESVPRASGPVAGPGGDDGGPGGGRLDGGCLESDPPDGDRPDPS